jgi:hypothetical protein
VKRVVKSRVKKNRVFENFCNLLIKKEDRVMKSLSVVLMFVVVVLVAVWSPAVQATVMVLDPMTQGNILAPPGGWHDDQGYNPPLLKDSAFSHDGDGSMMIDYSVFDGGQYDVVPRGYFGWQGTVGTGSSLPAIPTLSITDSITFWWYKPAAKWNPDTQTYDASPECVKQIQLYSNTSNDSPVVGATFDVATGEQSIPAGWHEAVCQLSQFNNIGNLDLAHIDLIDFWVSCWGYVGPWGEEGSYAIMPTNQPVYIDDLQIIPEPATMSLLGLGTLALLKRRKA